MELENKKIAIIGLGYVGLPLAVTFAEKYKVIGFDVNSQRVNELNSGYDSTLEVEDQILNTVLKIEKNTNNGLKITSDINFLKYCDIYIITVPTPTDKFNRPDLTSMVKASESVASYLKKDDVVIYESTVYPGVTEQEMVPVLERISGLEYNKDFYCGYSPERINPGDKEHKLTNIQKVTSGSTPEIADFVDKLYGSIIIAGTFKASSIKVAEASKVIENTQRDINIAFINELSKIFRLLDINTFEVLEAASTKWNFLNFKPGLVGGHCIGVDPYYLAQKATEVGFHPEMILAGRRINDSMGHYVVEKLVETLFKKNFKLSESSILILGFAFKENCPDFRNSKVIDIYEGLLRIGLEVHVYDPWIDREKVKKDYNLDLLSKIPKKTFEAVIIAVPHDEFINKIDFKSLCPNGILFDLKGILPKNNSDFTF